MRILALATNPETGASTRFRVLQWVPALEQAGFSLSLQPFFVSVAAEGLYRPGHVLAKSAAVIAGAIRRIRLLRRLHRDADLLLIHREAFPFGRRVLWRTLTRFPGPIVYDYDDAMFLPQRADRRFLRQLEDVDTPRALMERSAMVLAGNRFLADYARQYARSVTVLPTCIDTTRFAPRATASAPQRPLTVGWIGSHTTTKYLRSLQPVLEAVARQVPFRLHVVGGDGLPAMDGLDVEQARWRPDREVEDFARCDIGVYPLWDDAWAQGKCGFKAIQFMACGVPVVASAVGMTREILQDGVNGFLAASDGEWIEKLSRLLRDAQLRQRFGLAGRRTVEERYSVRAHAATLIQALRDAIDGPGHEEAPCAEPARLSTSLG